MRLGMRMAKEFSADFYNSKVWRQTRALYKQIQFGICERCGQPNGTEVHHKTALTPENITNPDISLNFDNFELLCSSCHNKEHKSKYSYTRDDVCFNDKGELVKKLNNDIAPLSKV